MRKLGINGGSVRGINAVDSVPLIRDAGFDCMFTGYRNDEYCGKIADAIDRASMSYDAVHAPFKGINNIWLPGEDGDIMLRSLTDCVDSCAHYGVPVMVVHLSSGDDAPCVNDIGHERFDRLVDHAGEAGVVVAFENQRKLANIAFAFEVYDRLPQVGFCWDNGHEACFADGREFMPLFGKKLRALHVHDNMKVHNQDLHLLPFDGQIDFSRFVAHIRESGYAGTLMLEVLPKNSNRYDELTPEQYYEKAYAAAVRLRKLVDGE